MPIKSCRLNNHPGFQWGNTNKCWTYTPGNEESRKEAKKKCIKQAISIEGPENFSKIMKNESKAELLDKDTLQEIIADENSTVEEAEAALDLLICVNPLDAIIAQEHVNAKKIARKSIHKK